MGGLFLSIRGERTFTPPATTSYSDTVRQEYVWRDGQDVVLPGPLGRLTPACDHYELCLCGPCREKRDKDRASRPRHSFTPVVSLWSPTHRREAAKDMKRFVAAAKALPAPKAKRKPITVKRPFKMRPGGAIKPIEVQIPPDQRMALVIDELFAQVKGPICANCGQFLEPYSGCCAKELRRLRALRNSAS